MDANKPKRRAVVVFFAWCAVVLFGSFALQIRRIYKIISGEDHLQFAISETAVFFLIFAMVIASALLMRYVYLQAKKAELTWLKIVSLILQILWFAMLPVGALGLLLGKFAA